LSQAWYILRRWPIIPVIILAVVLFVALFAEWVAPTDPNFQKLPNFALYEPTWGQPRPESELMAELEATIDKSTPVGQVRFNRLSKDAFHRNEFILGSDGLGRDVLSRIIYGARVSLKVTGYALLTGIIIGTAMGVLGGYYGGWLDEVLMRTVDVWNALPFLLVALIVALTLGATETTVIILIAMIAWPPFVRQVRADVLRIRSMDYVNAARIMGASNLRLMMRHVVPGTVSTILVVATLRVGGLILAESTLSFLGVGIPDPIPTWGKMVDEGYDFIINGVWWSSFFPGLAIFLLVMSLNFFGDWLRDRLDPRLRQLD
jgi:peptide/nickel transport system permease protein